MPVPKRTQRNLLRAEDKGAHAHENPGEDKSTAKNDGDDEMRTKFWRHLNTARRDARGRATNAMCPSSQQHKQQRSSGSSDWPASHGAGIKSTLPPTRCGASAPPVASR